MSSNEHKRSMSDAEKMKYYLQRVVESDPSTRQAKEFMKQITELAQGVPIDKFLEKFNLDGEYDATSTPPHISINIPGHDDPLVIDINDTNRKQFKDPKPEAKKSITSFLTPEELKELNDYE